MLFPPTDSARCHFLILLKYLTATFNDSPKLYLEWLILGINFARAEIGTHKEALSNTLKLSLGAYGLECVHHWAQ